MADDAKQSFLNRVRVQKDLEKFTGIEISSYSQGEELVAELASLSHDQQEFVYHWAEVVARSNDELARQFVSRAVAAFEHMDRIGVEQWAVRAMDAFDNRGLGAGIEIIEQLDDFVADYNNRHTRCTIDDVTTFLQHYVKGLGGRELSIMSDQETYTDTEKLFLPEVVNAMSGADENESLYKLTTVHLWAQTWFGTWRYQVIERMIRHHDLDAVLPIFNRLESIRLDACISRELPGLARELDNYAFDGQSHRDSWKALNARAEPLKSPNATALDSLNLSAELLNEEQPRLKRYQGAMRPYEVREAMFARIEREKAALQEKLSQIKNEMQPPNSAEDADMPVDPKELGEFQMSQDGDSEGAGEMDMQLTYDGDPVEMSQEMQDLLGSVMQDFGEIPDEYMEGIDPGLYPDDLEATQGDLKGGNKDESELEDAISYREWDYTRQRYREGFCKLSEFDVPDGDESFVQETLDKYRGLLKSIKRTFEAVLGETKLQRRQSDGDDIDIDALVEAHADIVSGREMSEYIYTKYRKLDRNIAVMFMVDMSGSTLGWVNDAERESLILLCEALQTLGDRYAIYGFSGRTNKRCEIYRVKTFDDRYDDATRGRISGIRPKSYTRMGVAIRHLGHLLNETRAKTKILITLSDGRPEDYGGYKGRYGIEDTRHALLELRRDGIHSFCITIDKEAQDYLPHMYGVANYAVIDEVKKLPLKVADIYRRLTT
ncbi:MAG: nitric oxide reductase activation protein NorD [Gammaproteobacteria bacterium]